MALPEGIKGTIVNGRPIVVDGELTDELPGQIVSPNNIRNRNGR